MCPVQSHTGRDLIRGSEPLNQEGYDSICICSSNPVDIAKTP